MIIFDTETTGLVEPYASPLAKQPYIIEFAAIKLEDTPPYNRLAISHEDEEVPSTIEFLVKPPIPLPEIITKITGLTDEDLKDEQEFPHHYSKLVDFFLGERHLIAHNVQFDVDLLRFQLMRMDHLLKFPWPSNHHCTVNLNMDILGHRIKQDQLFDHVTGGAEGVRAKTGVHRAMADVEDLTTIVHWMLENGRLPIG